MTPTAPDLRTRRRSVPCDRELLDCLARGWTMAEIAEEYKRSITAVQLQRNALKRRLGAKTSLQMLALYSRGQGLFDERGYLVAREGA